MKTKHSALKTGLFLCLVAFLSGCASGPELEKYSRSAVDRPYTLPKGVATWQIPVIAGYYKDDFSSVTIPPIPVPLIWQSSLSDTWTLNWKPIPLSLSHQFSQTEDQVIGTTFGLDGLGYSDTNGMVFMPSIEVYWRKKLGTGWAMELVPAFSNSIQTKGNTFRWEAAVGLGPLFQLSETFALRLRLNPGVSKNYDYTVASSPSVKPLGEARFVMPLGLAALWSFHRQWDLRASYSFNKIGQISGYQGHTFVFNFVHLW